MTKPYDAQHGIMLDGSFALHCTGCEECRRFDAEKPATVALLCLEGSVLWKKENHEPTPRVAQHRPETVVSKEAAKRAMKYK